MEIGTEVKRILSDEHFKKGQIGVIVSPIKSQLVDVRYDEKIVKQFIGNLKKASDQRGIKGNRMNLRSWKKDLV